MPVGTTMRQRRTSDLESAGPTGFTPAWCFLLESPCPTFRFRRRRGSRNRQTSLLRSRWRNQSQKGSQCSFTPSAEIWLCAGWRAELLYCAHTQRCL